MKTVVEEEEQEEEEDDDVVEEEEEEGVPEDGEEEAAEDDVGGVAEAEAEAEVAAQAAAAAAAAAAEHDRAFEAEFDKMMREAFETAGRTHLTGQAVTGDNLAVPLGVMRGRVVADVGGSGGDVALSLLKRSAKGKVEARSLVVPSDSTLAHAVASSRSARAAAARAAEDDVVKRLVLRAAESESGV